MQLRWDIHVGLSLTLSSVVICCVAVTECEDDRAVSNLVPIIVGAALGGLILIVLIAYLIGRKRSRRGYEQV